MNALRLNRQSIVLWFVAAVVLAGLLLLANTVLATPSSGVVGSPVASGVLPEVVGAKFKMGNEGFGSGVDVTNIVMVRYTVEPGGTFGWHQHGGPLWAVVSSGTLTVYSSDDPTCTPQLYPAGTAFLDPGDHTHLGINETSEPVEVYVTFMLPQGGQARIDVADPGICS